MDEPQWILCPVCKSKTRIRARSDTELKNFPLFCPKCKHESLVTIKQLNMSVIKATRRTDEEPIMCENTSHRLSALSF